VSVTTGVGAGSERDDASLLALEPSEWGSSVATRECVDRTGLLVSPPLLRMIGGTMSSRFRIATDCAG
jgi:hypothetical protein